ncbi:MAG: type II toxin-antitoxin system VapB family antitoxin [Ilumatobacteraceae bacterium]|nr:type II toxin-antitoxin system VapB family antitoxin [Ilumatobacter sp.]MCB0984518.1 type II toxin-antitoxin system VapB family antitoxin [Ilumatobacter sp.]
MIRRTTIELDDELVAEARAALGQPTVRATVEEALRRAVQAEKASDRARRQQQINALRQAAKLIDQDVLMSEEAWR